MTNKILKNLKAKRNLILSFLIILIGMLFTAEISFQRGFSRGALEWRDAKGRFFILNQQQLQCQLNLKTAQTKIINIELDNQQIKHVNDNLKQKIQSISFTNANLAQENALYKKILAPEYQQKGIQINSVQIYPLQQKGRFRYEVLLAKFSHQKKVTPGLMQLSIQGVQDEELIQIPFEVLSREWKKGQPYTVRYFQTLQGQLQLPEGFEPESIQISLLPKDKQTKLTSDNFPWLVSIG